jgi:serine/threonine protein kinase
LKTGDVAIALISGETAIGSVVGGKYVIEALIGEGGFATVYRARHTLIPSLRIAIKVLRREHVGNEDAVRRFQREALTAAALRNPHTVRIMDVGHTEAGQPYIVMEYVHGASLDRVLTRIGRLKPMIVARLGIGILQALDEAHGLGIIHRDLKPGNILVVKERGARHPVARVLDFGIAKVLADGPGGSGPSTATLGGMIFCTPQYAAPELIRGNPVFRSDLYALGQVMAEMLEGTPPFGRGNAFELAAKQLSDEVAPLGPIVRASALRTVIERAVSKDLGQRWESAGAMLEALEAVYEQMQLGARPAPAVTETVEEDDLSSEEPQSARTVGALAAAFEREAEESGDGTPTTRITGKNSAIPGRTGAGDRAAPRATPRPETAPAPVADDRESDADDAIPSAVRVTRPNAPPPVRQRLKPAESDDELPLIDTSAWAVAQQREGGTRYVVVGAAVLAVAVIGYFAFGAITRGGRAPAAVAISAASAALNVAARVPANHRFTVTSNVDTGEVWYRGEHVCDLPLLGAFGPDTRPIELEFRHPPFSGIRTTWDDTGPVEFRVPFGQPAP